MSERDHTSIEALLAARALDALEPQEHEELDRSIAEHAPCGTCDRLQDETADAVALLASSLDPVEPDPAIIDRVLAAPRTPSEDELAIRRRRRSWAQVAVAAAAAIVLVVASGVALRSGRQTPTTVASDQRIVHFRGGQGTLAMAYVPGRRGIALWGSGLPDPGAGRTYGIWMIDDGTPTAGGCVTPTDGRFSLYVDADLGTTQRMAVTVEPSSCPAAPTGTPVATASLS
jgi:anti-sigma-K factor RskA